MTYYSYKGIKKRNGLIKAHSQKNTKGFICILYSLASL